MAAEAPTKLRYKCLIMDHDETTVTLAKETHYQAYLEAARELLPDHKPISWNEWVRTNHYIGPWVYIENLFKDCGLDDWKTKAKAHWHKWMKRKVFDPSFIPGVLDVLKEFRARGGLVTVATNAPDKMVMAHYTAGTWATFFPDFVMGYQDDHKLMKPNPYPLEQIMQKFNLKPEECLMVDDMTTGHKAAKACGVDSACAIWANNLLVDESITCGAKYVVSDIDELRAILYINDPESPPAASSEAESSSVPPTLLTLEDVTAQTFLKNRDAAMPEVTAFPPPNKNRRPQIPEPVVQPKSKCSSLFTILAFVALFGALYLSFNTRSSAAN